MTIFPIRQNVPNHIWHEKSRTKRWSKELFRRFARLIVENNVIEIDDNIVN